MPAGAPALANADHVRQAVGIAGELDLVIESADTSNATAVKWLDDAAAAGTSANKGSVVQLTGLPAFLKQLNGQNDALPNADRTKVILSRAPAYFSDAVISHDHKLARVAFGLTRLTSVEEDRTILDRLGAAPSPPSGYHAYPAGLAVIASNALTQLVADNLRLNLLALGLVLVVLVIAYLAVYRQPLWAVFAVVPTAVAAGWTTGVLYLTGISSSPITVLLAGVVVAFATEFSVLWLSRYRSERRAGGQAAAAADLASSRIGPAVIASALALILGFGILALSPVPMVRDFGIWSAVNLALATVAVLVLLPPLARQWLR
jgi:predicted RND superfamily exporter protein